MSKHTIQRVFEVIHVLSLSIWLSAVGMSGAIAAIVFPMMRKLDPTLGAYPNYDGDHALLGAGRIAGTVFLRVDMAQFICATLALASFIGMLMTGYSLNTLSRVARSVLLLLTMALLSWHLMMLMPGMTSDLREYWKFAQLGDSVQADVHKDAFMALHETAAGSLKGLVLGTLLCLILSIWTGIGKGSDRNDQQSTT